MHFLADYISAPRGCCALKFLRALEIDQALIAHTRSGIGVPPKTFNRENLKFGLKFSVLATITSGLVGVSSQNIFQQQHSDSRSWSVFTALPPGLFCRRQDSPTQTTRLCISGWSDSGSYKLAVLTFKIRRTVTPAYHSRLITARPAKSPASRGRLPHFGATSRSPAVSLKSPAFPALNLVS